MRKTTTTVLALLILAVACTKKSDSYSPNCGTPKTYSADVSPIIQSTCATAGCHNAGSTRGPGALTTYQQIFNARGSIRNSVAAGSMPQGMTLTAAQKDAILCWIDNGAPNN